MRVTALCLLVVVLSAPPAAAQQAIVLKAACIGGAINSVTEVTATADGTISRRNYVQSSFGGRDWKVFQHTQLLEFRDCAMKIEH